MTATAVVGEAPELEVVGDLLPRAVPVAAVAIALAAVVAGAAGALSAALAVVLVAANLALAATSLAWAARFGPVFLMAVALGGYVVRLGILFAVVLVLRDRSWIHLPSLGLTVVATHLGLLFWELRYVSASLAHPGLKPPSAPASKEP